MLDEEVAAHITTHQVGGILDGHFILQYLPRIWGSGIGEASYAVLLDLRLRTDRHGAIAARSDYGGGVFCRITVEGKVHEDACAFVQFGECR